MFFCDRNDFEYLQMDTDSAYFSISKENLEDIVLLEKRQMFTENISSQCHLKQINPDVNFLPRNCCREHAKFDSREPGLFKLEFSGKKFIGLCSKTYIVSQSEKDYKMSTKGVNKNKILNPQYTFESVLSNATSQNVTNMGIKLKCNTLFTYEQEKCGFSYLYCKRRVLDDGIHTTPLDITLCPVSKKVSENEDDNVLQLLISLIN